MLLEAQENGEDPGHIRFRKADDPHWLELKKDEDGNEILYKYFLYGNKKERMGIC